MFITVEHPYSGFNTTVLRPLIENLVGCHMKGTMVITAECEGKQLRSLEEDKLAIATRE